MGPKIEAVCRFIEAGGRFAAIGNLSQAAMLLDGQAGTDRPPPRGLNRSEVEDQVDHTVTGAAAHGQPRVVEDSEHPAVVRQDLSDQPAHLELTSSSRRRRRNRTVPSPSSCQLSATTKATSASDRSSQPIESGDGDDLVLCGGDDGLTRGVIDMGGAVRPVVAQPPVRAEEPEVGVTASRATACCGTANSPAASAALIGCSRTVVPYHAEQLGRDPPC